MHEDKTAAKHETKNKNNIKTRSGEETSNLNSPFCERYICVLCHQSYHNILYFHIPTFHTFTYAYIKG